MVFSEISMWTYTKDEIIDLKPKFEKEFDVKLIHDYENDWEWIWNGEESKTKVNISREHNWESGELSKPLRIIISWESSELSEDQIIRKVQNVLSFDMYFGTISGRGINIEDYIVNKIIKHET